MSRLLICMYILQANGMIIPEGCFIAAWALALVKLLASTVEIITKTK